MTFFFQNGSWLQRWIHQAPPKAVRRFLKGQIVRKSLWWSLGNSGYFRAVSARLGGSVGSCFWHMCLCLLTDLFVSNFLFYLFVLSVCLYIDLFVFFLSNPHPIFFHAIFCSSILSILIQSDRKSLKIEASSTCPHKSSKWWQRWLDEWHASNMPPICPKNGGWWSIMRCMVLYTYWTLCAECKYINILHTVTIYTYCTYCTHVYIYICTLLPGPLETTQKAKVLPFLVLLVCVALVVLVVHLVLAVVVEGSSMMTIITTTSSTAQGGGGSFKNRKRIGEIDCCEWRMSEQKHWPTD